MATLRTPQFGQLTRGTTSVQQRAMLEEVRMPPRFILRVVNRATLASALGAGEPAPAWKVHIQIEPTILDRKLATRHRRRPREIRSWNPKAAGEFCVWAPGSMKQDSIERVVDWCTKAKSDMPPRNSALEAGKAAFNAGLS